MFRYRLARNLFAAILMLVALSTGACRRTDQQIPKIKDPPPTAAQSSPAALPEVVGNATCPVSGKPVGGSAAAPSFYSDFHGKRVGFMCPNCKGTFDSAAEDKKLDLLNKALASVGLAPVK